MDWSGCPANSRAERKGVCEDEMVTRQEDSIKKLNERKTNEQLSRENAALREQVADLQAQVEEQADALIELAAMVGGEG